MDFSSEEQRRDALVEWLLAVSPGANPADVRQAVDLGALAFTDALESMQRVADRASRDSIRILTFTIALRMVGTLQKEIEESGGIFNYAKRYDAKD